MLAELAGEQLVVVAEAVDAEALADVAVEVYPVHGSSGSRPNAANLRDVSAHEMSWSSNAASRRCRS
jgi:hypothetical protein